jgi:hypothetical protein
LVAVVQGDDAPPEVVGKHVLELGERECARLLDAAHGSRTAQPDSDRDRLVGLEQEGRQPPVLAEAVTAGRTAHRLDRVAELAEPVDVLADRALPDVEQRGQLGPGGAAACLQLAQQRDEA